VRSRRLFIPHPLWQLYASVYQYYQSHPEQTPSFLTTVYLNRLQPFFADRELHLAASSQVPLEQAAVGAAEDQLIRDTYNWATSNNLPTFADIAPNPFQLTRPV
jgi:hypothetical protein